MTQIWYQEPQQTPKANLQAISTNELWDNV